MSRKKSLSEFDRLPKRVQAIIATMRKTGEKLCKHLHHKETGETEINFFFEPSGKRCGPRSAAQATETEFLILSGDGLLGADTSQTWTARRE
jgi:hypothetical protein